MDFQPPPPPEDRIQAEALRVAFPRYTINMITKRGRVLFEAVCRNGSNPYCVISSDAKEIWRELKASAR
jgi:hypothetical protein